MFLRQVILQNGIPFEIKYPENALELKPEVIEAMEEAKQGKVIAKLTNPYQNRVDKAKSLFGILPEDVDEEHERAERLCINR